MQCSSSDGHRTACSRGKEGCTCMHVHEGPPTGTLWHMLMVATAHRSQSLVLTSAMVVARHAWSMFSMETKKGGAVPSSQPSHHVSMLDQFDCLYRSVAGTIAQGRKGPGMSTWLGDLVPRAYTSTRSRAEFILAIPDPQHTYAIIQKLVFSCLVRVSACRRLANNCALQQQRANTGCASTNFPS